MTADTPAPADLDAASPSSVDDWLPDVPAAPKPAARKAPARPGAAKSHLRPVDQLADDIANAPHVAGPAPSGDRPAEAPPPAKPAAAAPDKPRQRPWGEIWEECPVRPLGVLGGVQYLLDIHGQMRAEKKLDTQVIVSLFGHRQHLLWRMYPSYNKGSDTPVEKRFDQGKAMADIMAACAERGVFNPDGAVRGPGAWVDDDGNLVYHAGDKLFIGLAEQRPGEHGGRFYPAHPAIPHPQSAATDPAQATLDALTTWRWDLPDIGPMVTLGMIGCQMLGGALDWRPSFWFTGGPGTGKSALNRLLGHLHGGDKGLIASPDATARGIASLLGHSSLPVALDELEPGDGHRERQIVETARVANSGGRWVRGSSDQTGSSGQLRSTFMFSSVLIPGLLKSQDLQRLIILTLQPFAEGATPPDLRPDTWRKRGAALKAALIDRWPSWSRRLDLWREAFASAGITGRAADNWATTLAMANMALSAALPEAEEMAGWTAKLADIIRADTDAAGSDARDVLTYLLSQEFDVLRRGERFTIAQWVMVAAASRGAPRGLLGDFPDDPHGRTDRARAANAHLAKAGIRVLANGKDDPALFVANDKLRPLVALFEGSQWAEGAWRQSLERVPGAQKSGVVRTLAGHRTRGTEIPLSAIGGLMDDPDHQPATTAPQAVSRPAPAPGYGPDYPPDMGEFV